MKLGETLHQSGQVTDVSEEKATALGTGHFVTTVTEYTNDAGEVVGAMTFRILKFKPGTGRMAAADTASDALPPFAFSDTTATVSAAVAPTWKKS